MFIKLFTIFFFSFLFQSLKSSPHVLNFTYNGFRNPVPNISIQGIAKVTPKGLLKLTDKTLTRTGHAFCDKPIRFKDSPNATVSSFSTTFVFTMNPQTPTLSGHGLAFVVASNSSIPFSSPNQFLGLFNDTNNDKDTNHVFAVEFDRINNIEFADPNNNHVGIDINSLMSVKSSPAGYWDEKDQFNNLSLISRRRMQVWVDYNGLTHRIDVVMAPFSLEKPRKPLISTVRDLSTVFLQDMYVGFSASTGSIWLDQFVLGWSFRLKGEASPLALWELPRLLRFKGTRMHRFYTRVMPLVALVVVPILIIISLIFLVRFIMRRRRKFSEELEDWETEFAKNRIRFKDLYYATKGFKDKNFLRSGGFGRVYRGLIPKTKKEVALKRVSNESRQGLKEFVAEIVSIGQMSHRNLVPLMGYCRRRNELLLVYDYMSNGSLDKYLYNSPEVTLNWKQRFKVIIGVASAFFYIKASNVLLDAELNGRLGDFGLAQLCDHGADPQTPHIIGT